LAATDKNNRSMKKKETLFDILLKVSELRMDIETAEKRILRLFNVSVAKRKVCPQCKREFDHTEVPSGIFCCYACENGY
jgi:hypothetical protein